MQLPPQQHTPSAWYGSVLQNQPQRWTLTLSAAQVLELATAADACLLQSDDVGKIVKANFHLPNLALKLEEVRTALLSGLGFMLIKGIDKEQFSTLQLAAMFYGFGAHLGNARMQNAQGHILGHVRDLNLRSDDPKVRIYQTSERQTFHTDSADVVALLCLNKAKSGGESLLVSAVTVFNEMRKHYPQLLTCLLDPIATDRRGEVPPGMPPYFSIPVFTWYQQQLNVIYQRQYIDSAQRFAGAFKLTARHIEALDKFDQLCNDPKFNLRMQLQPGDMQFVYNHSLLHDRTSFEDYQPPQQRRHLLRLWLSMPGDRELPAVYAQRFESVSIGERGGMNLPAVKPTAPLQVD